MATPTQESRFQAEDVRLEEVYEITQALVRIANSTDAKDWKRLREQFSETVNIDLGERGPSQAMTADEFVDWIAAAYGGMETFHLVSNHDVQIWPGIDVGTTGNAEDRAQVISYGHVLHRQIGGGETLHIDCRYEHELSREERGWRVTRLKVVPFRREDDHRWFERGAETAAIKSNESRRAKSTTELSEV